MVTVGLASNPTTLPSIRHNMGDKSFLQKLEEYNEGDRDQNPIEEVPQWKIAIVTGGLILVNLIAWPLLLGGEATTAFVILVGGVFAVGMMTETGRSMVTEALEEIENQNQEQASSDESRVCSNCGWQNPVENNYCHDCGEKLASD